MNATAPGPAGQPTDEDRLRADLYNYLGLVLSRPMDRMTLDQTAALEGDDSALGRAITKLATAARDADVKDVKREYNALFIGLGRGELLPYASFYLTGFLNEKPLGALRRDFMALGLARAEGVFEPEDGIASLMEVMGAIIVGRFGAPLVLSRQRDFWGKHVAPWAGHFFTDLSKAKTASLYAAVGDVGREFMEIEREAFRLATA
ncbi:chaperone TorD involved in molybdoenzyme TorA maturation [Jannaschia faecimaris]|uniref:Chaperone TorD involved in molybdoenzyme TorA maturation n=1 Tax=Jannaschia faecimaris TaxID=1244108 RepID=A0A1H3JLA8_9RHOB|nr:molecular chaperone TorD family protein [Jannaschia faecimaris]SDY40701.1 chaperone TorD involved in molybdoenzyme TorA maturation [Jannaschia faecimaris]